MSNDGGYIILAAYISFVLIMVLILEIRCPKTIITET